jgi:hypothetical protein
VCRPSTGICDPEERCSGKTSTCPEDKVTPDGTVCSSPSSPGDSNLKCASGQCTSRDQQCKTVMGRLTSSNDTRSCDSTNCVLTCQAPEFGIDMCLRMQQNFLDGTPCKGDGVCMNGYCKGASTLGEVRSWIDKVCYFLLCVFGYRILVPGKKGCRLAGYSVDYGFRRSYSPQPRILLHSPARTLDHE